MGTKLLVRVPHRLERNPRAICVAGFQRLKFAIESTYGLLLETSYRIANDRIACSCGTTIASRNARLMQAVRCDDAFKSCGVDFSRGRRLCMGRVPSVVRTVRADAAPDRARAHYRAHVR